MSHQKRLEENCALFLIEIFKSTYELDRGKKKEEILSELHNYFIHHRNNGDTTSLEERLEDVLKTLSYRNREIIKLLYGLDREGYRFTHHEVGCVFKITPEQVAEREVKALNGLRHPTHLLRLAGFIGSPLRKE